MQVIFFKENLAVQIASTEYRELLQDGDTVNRPYVSKPRKATYTKGTDITAQDYTATNEQLTVNTTTVVPYYVNVCVLA